MGCAGYWMGNGIARFGEHQRLLCRQQQWHVSLQSPAQSSGAGKGLGPALLSRWGEMRYWPDWWERRLRGFAGIQVLCWVAGEFR